LGAIKLREAEKAEKPSDPKLIEHEKNETTSE
jgi:hypothetical protein